jgi:thiol-disulfide isomerase/thioredoxin
MRAPTDAVPVRRLAAAAGLLAAVVLVVTSCGGEEEPAATADAGDDAVPTEPMDAPSPTVTGEAETDDVGTAEETDEADAGAKEDTEALAAGIYREFSEDALAEPGYETNVIFFHASWCPECRAFEQSIEAGPIPNGVQILKADYDTETELKQKYDVTIQTTFVKVDEDGEMISSWIGYQQDRSVDNLLDQLG